MTRPNTKTTCKFCGAENCSRDICHDLQLFLLMQPGWKNFRTVTVDATRRQHRVNFQKLPPADLEYLTDDERVFILATFLSWAATQKLMVKTCPVCKSIFEPKMINKKYCSRRCKDAAFYKKEFLKKRLTWPTHNTCANCKSTFERVCAHQKYCCENCASAAYRKRKKAAWATGTCPVCKLTFERRSPTNKYCSPDCRYTAQQKRRAAVMALRPKQILGEATCAHCKSTFEPSNRNQKYCSQRCNKAASRKRLKQTGRFNRYEKKPTTIDDLPSD